MRRGYLIKRASASTPDLGIAPCAQKSETKHDHACWPFAEPYVDSARAELFSELTEKAWRLYFTREEKVAIDELLRSRAIHANPAAESPKLSQEQTRDLSYSPPRGSSIVSAVPSAQMAPPAQETFFYESQDGRDEKRALRSRRPSFLKTLSIITDSRRTSLDPPADPLSPTSPRHRSSFSFQRRSSTPTVELPLAPSQYYQDPEARMKLKTFLACPQNFDQALELGFPSAAKPHVMHVAPRLPDLPKAPTVSANNDVQTFLRDASFFDDDDESDDDNPDDNDADDDLHAAPRGSFEVVENLEHNGADDDDCSLPDSDSPITPLPLEKIQAPHKEPRVTQRGIDKFANGAFHDQQAVDESMWTGDREMTLRMTLTKPELRAPEEQLYGWRRSGPGDPLALEALPTMKDHSALRGHGRKTGTSQEGSKVRGLWRKMRTSKQGVRA